MTIYYQDMEKEFQAISDHTGLDVEDIELLFGSAFEDDGDLVDPNKKTEAQSNFELMLNVQAGSEFGPNMPQPDAESLKKSIEILFDSYIRSKNIHKKQPRIRNKV